MRLLYESADYLGVAMALVYGRISCKFVQHAAKANTKKHSTDNIMSIIVVTHKRSPKSLTGEEVKVFVAVDIPHTCSYAISYFIMT